MKVLIDANVILTYLSGRDDPYTREADLIMQKCANEEIDGSVALHTLSIVWYQTRKLPESLRREWIRQICTLLTVSGTNNDAVLRAVENSDFRDFEDALQDCCASSYDADYIVTANVRDYKGVSTIPALTPAAFLDLCV